MSRTQQLPTAITTGVHNYNIINNTGTEQQLTPATTTGAQSTHLNTSGTKHSNKNTKRLLHTTHTDSETK